MLFILFFNKFINLIEVDILIFLLYFLFILFINNLKNIFDYWINPLIMINLKIMRLIFISNHLIDL